jgi:ribosome-associated translation inhibitor RaiA
MKIQLRPRGITLTKAQRIRLEHDLGIVLARLGERIDRVIVVLSDAEEAGFKCCEIEVRIKPQLVKVEHSDTDVFLAVEHAAKRAARSVTRALEAEGLIRR